MNAKNETITTGLDRLNAAFAWWGLPAATGNGNLDGPLKCFQTFAADLQKLYGEAYGTEMTTLRGANDKLAGSLQEFLRCRQPQDVIAVEAKIMATMLEATSAQAKLWGDFAQKLQDCCATMARDTADELRSRGVSTGDNSPSSEKAA